MTAEEMLGKHGGVRCQVTVRTEAFDDPAQVKAKLESFASRDGWICYADGWWWRFGSETGPSGQERCGHPLSAEFVLGDGKSASLRHDGARWVWTEIEEGGEQAWAFDETFFSTAGPAWMRYRVYWTRAKEGLDGVRPWRPYVARFDGWEVE